MGKPRCEVEDKNYYKDIYFLYKILGLLENVDEVKLVLKDLLTRSELRMLKRRWHIAELLSEGFDIRTTAQKSKTSTQTVGKIKNVLEHGKGGLKLALERMNEELHQEQKQFKTRNRTHGGSTFVKRFLP